MSNFMRIVLWITLLNLWISLWITLLFMVLLCAPNRRNSDSPIRKQSEKFRFLTVKISSSYSYYYYLIYINLLNRLSSRSLKLLTDQIGIIPIPFFLIVFLIQILVYPTGQYSWALKM